MWDNTLPNSTTYFLNGQLAMYFGLYKDAYNIKRQNGNLHFSVNPVPQLPSDQSTIPSVSYANYWVNGVSNKSNNKEVAWDFLKFMSSQESLRKLYQNEVKVRGYGNLYPRSDMQSELLTDSIAAPFIYQAGFAKSWYLYGNTHDGASGINSQISKPFQDAIDAANLQSDSSKALDASQPLLEQVLASYGLIALPKATP
jgi:ABC-type glycerol-3-phosphate transport system substrate-binding protein